MKTFIDPDLSCFEGCFEESFKEKPKGKSVAFVNALAARSACRMAAKRNITYSLTNIRSAPHNPATLLARTEQRSRPRYRFAIPTSNSNSLQLTPAFSTIQHLMRLLYFAAFLAPAMATASENALDAHGLYALAMAQLAQLPSRLHTRPPVYSHANLHRGIDVPQYDPQAQDYISVHKHEPNVEASAQLHGALGTLEEAAQRGSAAASVALADIYTFGNYSVPANYTRALAHYHEAVARAGDGHAYFMLAHMYGTGMFGELAVDKQRARTYYAAAARNGNVNAVLALANQHLHGVDCTADCETAQFYYSTVARRVVSQLDAEGILDTYEEPLAHNINLADFAGGLFGGRLSESVSSVRTPTDNVLEVRDMVKDYNIELPDSQMLDLYFDALLHYRGSYFSPRNASRAYIEALTCAYTGLKERDAGRLRDFKSTDGIIWSRCQGILGHMYLTGQGVERDIPRAYRWLSSAAEHSADDAGGGGDVHLYLALLRRLDPTTNGVLSPLCFQHLKDAAKKGSAQGVFIYARSLVAPASPFEANYQEATYDLIRTAAFRGNYQATFFLADAVEAGAAAAKGELYGCTELAHFYKRFAERSESFVLPHLRYAFEELQHGNYKNALLGYLIAAEQGLLNAQLSSAHLLYQPAPLLAWERKTYTGPRVQAALRYLDLASAQGHIDATILLGDLYLTGLPNGGLAVDYTKAFSYYNAAALSASAHGCYKLGYMYEYGLGCAHNSLDYFMAKRYYDLSVKYFLDRSGTKMEEASKPNSYALDFALLRLGIKAMFTKTEKRQGRESVGWFSTLNKLAKSKEAKAKEANENSNAQAHAHGESFGPQEDYQLFDYIVLIFTMAFFLYVGFQNMRARFRQQGQRQNPPDGDRANEANQPRFRFEFFFAI